MQKKLQKFHMTILWAYVPATLEYSPSIANEDHIMEWQEFGCDWDEYPTWMYYAGLLGKPTKLLPTNCNFERGRSRYYTWSKSSDNMQTILVEDDSEVDGSWIYTFTWSSASTGIPAVEKSEVQTESKVYGADGRIRTSPQRGFNIIERGNGRYEKVMK